MKSPPRANIDTARNWNATFKVGQVVILDGQERRTWSPAAVYWRGNPCVFLDGDDGEPVLLSRLEVPGYEWGVVDRRKRPNERPAWLATDS